MESSLLISILDSHKRVYFYGRSGIGKTFDITRVLKPYTPMEYDVLRYKQTTIDFLQKVTISKRILFIDDYDAIKDLIGIRELDDFTGQMVIIGNSEWNGPFKVYEVEYPQKSINYLCDTFNISYNDAKESNGDIRSIIHKSNDKDIYWSSKIFMKELLCKKGSLHSRDYIGDIFDEQGHLLDIVFDNYIESTYTNDIIESLSNADIFDTKMYKGAWYLAPYMTNESCIYPAYVINHSINKVLRKGSIWTKYSNMCMKKKKMKTMDKGVDIYSYYVIMNDTELSKEYKLVRGAMFHIKEK